MINVFPLKLISSTKTEKAGKVGGQHKLGRGIYTYFETSSFPHRENTNMKETKFWKGIEFKEREGTK